MLRKVFITCLSLLLTTGSLKAQTTERDNLLVKMYMTIVYGKSSLIGDKYKSIQGEKLEERDGNTLYAVTDIKSKIISAQYIMRKQDGTVVLNAEILPAYKDAVLQYMQDWETRSKPKNEKKPGPDDTLYVLRDSIGGDPVFIFLISNKPDESIKVFAFPL